MKVILCFVLVAVASCAASPMFGASGMMKRRFPGAPDMTVRTYREITNNNAGRTGNIPGAATGTATPNAAPAVARFGPNTQGGSDQSWMFSNSGPTQLAVQPSLQYTNRPALRPSPTRVPTLRLDNIPTYQENSVDNFQAYDDYPTSFYPRESYAHLDFPEPYSFDDFFGAGRYEAYRKPISMPKRHYY